MYYLPLSPEQELLWSGADAVGDACTLLHLRLHFEWTPVEGMLEGAGPQKNVGAGHPVLAGFERFCCM